VKTCNSCHKIDKGLSVCGSCKKVYYCSVECQKLDWKQHKAACKESCRRMDISVIHVERDVNAEPAASEYPIEVGAYVYLTGLVERDDYDQDDFDHCHSYNGERGVLLGYDKSSGRWEIEIDTKEPVEILSVHPSNVCVEEPPAQRDHSGRIILKRNEGGFADQIYWPYVEANERRKREGWKPFPDDPNPPEGSPSFSIHTWTRAEEDAISGALRRLANSVAPKNPNEDDDDNSSDEDPVDSEGYTILGDGESRGRLAAPSDYVDGWPADLICGEHKYCGPHYGCCLPAIYGRNRDQCICEFCFCGYIYKHECSCSAKCWGLCSTMGWDELIRTVHLPSTKKAVAQAATRVAPNY
jgi:hypothetical protein